MRNRYAFVGGNSGRWRIASLRPVRGEVLPHVRCVDVVPVDAMQSGRPAGWVLTGQISNVRYAKRAELTVLGAKQEALGRPRASRAALIPIKKSPEWWDLAQDERREIFEEQSRHTAIGLEYLPGVARQLYHCRDLGEPFDFLTWFEYAPEHADAFEHLVDRLRSTKEWAFVEREVDIRLELAV
jgi:hypothetical protein